MTSEENHYGDYQNETQEEMNHLKVKIKDYEAHKTTQMMDSESKSWTLWNRKKVISHEPIFYVTEPKSLEYASGSKCSNSVEEKVNTRALPQHAQTYKLEEFEKKALLIFNQENIDGFKPRYGTEKDVEVLKNTFEKFDFEVITHKDLTKKEILDQLKMFCRQDFTDYGCIGVAVLTHGSADGLINAKDQQYSEIEIIDEFKVHNKPTLVTKPKFIIIQACRGMVQTAGAAVLHSKVHRDQPASVEPYILPVEADMLILHSSFPGTPSHRDKYEGSWFVQSLCGKINQLAATHDLESIMTEVKKQVAIEKEDEIYNSNLRMMQVNKQMPVMNSTLIRKLYLRKFGDSPVIPLEFNSGNHNDDIIVTQGKNDVNVTHTRNDVIGTQRSNKVIVTQGNNDVIVTKGSNDVIVTQGSNNVIVTQENNEVIVTIGSDDVDVTHTSNDVMGTQKSHEVIVTQRSNEVIVTQGSNDVIVTQGNSGDKGNIDVIDAPTAQRLVEGSCPCFKKHFEYMKHCFKCYIEDNPDDDVAQVYLDIADSLGEDAQFDAAKEKILEGMRKHLFSAQKFSCYKFLYFESYR